MHIIVIHLFIMCTDDILSFNSNTTGVTCGAGTANTSEHMI